MITTYFLGNLKSKIGNSGISYECCEICGVLEGFCLECCHACKEAPCECTCFHCQQPNCICCADRKEHHSICGRYDELNEEEHDVSCQKSKIAQSDCGMTCQQSTIQRPCHQKPITSVMTRATTRAKEKITRCRVPSEINCEKT